MIRRVLIANRGEIARRVIRTCRAMHIGAVAVYSDADADAPHVREADEAIRIGPARATESYLNIPAVVEAATRAGADAVHPGYGFLSENAAFAEACEAAGLTFVGPPAAVIRGMGSKTGARKTVSAAGVPIVPGDTPVGQAPSDIAAAVRSIGLPALLKAAAGGGGKGMRVVRNDSEVDEASRAAQGEAKRAFGNGTLYVERLVERARHIEVQIFGDGRGGFVHLFERDCSLQRRHQKVIEEAPAPRLSPAVRERLHAAALAAARAVGYVNAGTVEFLVEGEGDEAKFYFLEMNTRLQVEHPITEAITGLDLVQAQLLVAGGEGLPFKQQDVTITGHAFEARVYAEDARRLLPQTGTLLRYREPHGDGIRVDAGVVEGQTIGLHYDPLISKVIAHAPTREAARARLIAALGDYPILGLHHNLAFLKALLERDEVRDARVDTTFIERELTTLAAPPPPAVRRAAAAIAAYVAARADAPAPAPAAGSPAAEPAGLDPWDTIGPVRW